MSKKIIQLSTPQCPPCQVYKKEIEKIIGKTEYIFEYISLYTGPDPIESYDDYWNEINNNLVKYTKEYGIILYTFPSFLIIENNQVSKIDKTQIIKFLQNESK